MQFDAYYQTSRQSCYSSWIGENNPRGDCFIPQFFVVLLKYMDIWCKIFLKSSQISKIRQKLKTVIVALNGSATIFEAR